MSKRRRSKTKTRHLPVSDFTSLPATATGKWAGILLVISLSLVVLNTTVIMPFTEQRSDYDLAQLLVNLVSFLCVASAGVCGLIALTMKRERSWVVATSVLVLAALLVFALPDLFGAS